jgi:hypothetical protein
MTARRDEDQVRTDEPARDQARRDRDERRGERPSDDTEREMAEADTADGERRPDEPERGSP